MNERIARVRAMLRELSADCERDVAMREGQPLTGANVAAWLAEINAMQAATADALVAVIDEMDAS